MTRTYRIFALAALTSTFMIPAVQAGDGTVNFKGQLIGQTCTVSVNGGSNMGTVTLPTLGITALGAVGATAGRTQFTIGLSACGTGNSIQDFVQNLTGNSVIGKTASTYFESGPGVDPTTRNIINTGGATGVQLQLLDSGGDVIKAGDPGQPRTPAITNLASNGGVMTYGVQYIANDVIAPGSVVGSVTYSIAYN
ncbi:fimbrial protein [Pseudomonas sp. F8002]|uniref:fimbrial protein n=1 Tax=Pseudomonas sp. F8002 TaxID=2738822 RepID=UPI0015A43AAE|nr:fimbrial protein [Pseudomonas sp. F8002]NWB54665.1 type 1 fimbrial protein [Pseudomonas sp. F8002]